MTVANEWNWIDCFGQTPENGLSLLACGYVRCNGNGTRGQIVNLNSGTVQ